MHIAAVLKRKGAQVISLLPEDSVAEAARRLTQHKIGAVLVMAEGATHPVGILSERDIVRALSATGASTLNSEVQELMTRDLVTGSPDDTVSQVMTLMTTHRIRHLPILENEKLVGLISIGDVVKARIDEAELEVESLRGFVASIG